MKDAPKPRTQTETYHAAREEHRAGTKAVIEAPAADNDFAVVFEDDGETAYFYALDTALEGNPIVDAVHIYDTDQVPDAEKPFFVSVIWSADSTKAGLLIDAQPYAVFDFTNRVAYNDSGFPPPPDDGWKRNSDDNWRDKCREFFFE